MIGSPLRTISSMALAVLLAAPALADGPSVGQRLERLRVAEASLSKDPARLRLRHNLDKLAADWRALAQRADGAERVAALEGEARALALLAHWSGTAEDKAAAAKAKQRVAAAKDDDRPARKDKSGRPDEDRAARKEIAKAKKREPSTLARIDLEIRELGVEVLLPSGAELTSRSELIPAKKGQPERLYFDVSPLVAERRALATITVDHPSVARLRVGQHDRDTVRFVFDLPAGARAPELMALVDGATPRLRLGKRGDWATPERSSAAETDPLAALLEVQKALDQVAPGEAATVTPEAQRALEAMVAELREEEGADDVEIEIAGPPAILPPAALDQPPALDVPPATGINKTTRAALGQSKGALVRVRRVLIDAGHGGKDGGATGKRGTLEKDVNLGIATALAKVLRERLGVEVVMTRTKDVYLSLGKRVQIANQSNADLFISVHSNAHRNKKFMGIETYYLNTTSNRYANRLAARENQEQFDESTLDAGDPTEGAGEADEAALPGGALGRDLRLLLADLAMRSATDDSRRLAGLVQSNLVGQLRRVHGDVTDLGVKSALFYVLLGARMPSILVESGFLSHPEEERRLADPAYQRKVAEAIAAGVARFVEERNQVASRL